MGATTFRQRLVRILKISVGLLLLFLLLRGIDWGQLPLAFKSVKTGWLLGVFATNDSGMNKLNALWPEPHFLNLYSSSGLSASGLPQNIAAFLIHVFSLVVMCLLISFLISFYFSANTVIYALLRNREEGLSIDEVYTEFDDNGMESVAIESKPEKSKAQPKSKKRADSPKKQKKEREK